jgi:hypothetical protein
VTTDPNLMLPGEIEPWRCESCGALIHNVDESGYPRAGATQPKFFDERYKSVCTACFEMVSVIRNSTYWRAVQDQHLEHYKQIRKNPS